MTEHTKEPWAITHNEHVGWELFSDDDRGGTGEPIAQFVEEEDAIRALACVNACEGISTEDLERWRLFTPDAIYERDTEIEQLKATIAELVAACEESIRILDFYPDAYGLLESAIAKAKGGRNHEQDI
jgi:hypothetical protein